MNKLLIITLLVILFSIGIGIWYKYFKADKSDENVEGGDSQTFLTGLGSGGTADTFDIAQTHDEAQKMISTKLLKNSVMSKKPLRKPSDFNMFGQFVGPTGNGTVPIQIIRPEANGAIGFYTQDGQYIKGVLYNLNTGEKLGTRYYQGTNINSATWTEGAMNSYNISTTIPGGMTVAIAEIKNIYPNYIREGLFYIKLSGSPDNNALCLGGYIHKDNDAITGMGLQIRATDLNVDRNAFAQNSFTTFANNDNIKNKFSALPILLNFASKNDNEFSFYMKDIRRGIGQQVNIFAGDNETYIINDGTFCIIDLRHGRMPWYNNSTGRFSSSQAWYKWYFDSDSPRTCGDGPYKSRFRTYRILTTGDNNNTFYIQEIQSGQYFCNKGTGLLEASNSNDGTDKMKWVLEYTTQNSCDGYIIRSKLDNRWLRWINDWNKWELNNGTGPDWAWAIIRPDDLGWSSYDFFRSISKADDQDRAKVDWNGPDIVSAINHYGWNKKGASITGTHFENTNDHRHGCYENYSGNWIVHNGSKLLQVPYGVPGMRIGGTNANDTASLYTFVQNKGGWSIKSKYRNKYLSFSLNKGTIVPVFSSTDLNQALTFDLVPVLDENLANKYVRASIAYINGQNNREDLINGNQLGDPLVEKFCGNQERFNDGTLKLNLGIPNAIDPDPLTGTFEKICACNMNQLGENNIGFYQQRLCSDDYILREYGITNREFYPKIRDTIKCLYPNCRFQKCKLVHDIPDPQERVKNSKNYAQDCGSNTMCVANQTFNVNGAMENSTVNMSAEVFCGLAGENGVGEGVSNDLTWLPNPPYIQPIYREYLIRFDDAKIVGKTPESILSQFGFSLIRPSGRYLLVKQNSASSDIDGLRGLTTIFEQNAVVDETTKTSEMIEGERLEGERLEGEQKERSDAIMSVPIEISRVPGFSGNYDDFSNEKNQTAEMCRQKAIQSNGRYVAWGHRNSNHPDPNYKNTCFLYKSPPFLKPNSAFNPITQLNDNVHLSGCLKEGDIIMHGCKSRDEITNNLKDLEVEIFEEPNYTSSLGKFKYGNLPPQAWGNKPIRSIKVPVGKMVNLVVNLSGNPETQNLIKGNVPFLNVNGIEFMLIRDDVYELF